MSGSTKPKLGSALDHERLVVPDSLRGQLLGFRSRVWSSKLGEAVLFGVVAVLLAFLTVYVVDRFLDTPRTALLGIFLAALAAWLVLPWALHRWVWRNRTLDQLARLLRVREPSVGDQLLSVIELADNASEQARSRSLCAAAIKQVAESAQHRDFNQAAPPTRIKSLAWVFSIAGVATILLAILFPTAANNAWARFSAPWKNTPRYTFTAVQPLSPIIVVPHGETVPLDIRLSSESRWHPEVAHLQLANLTPLAATLDGDTYHFELPPQTTELPLRLKVGDYKQVVKLEPKLRPELIAASATIKLPAYLERPEAVEQDVRSGSLTVVDGSQATITAAASRALRSASVNGEDVAVDQERFSSAALAITGEESKLTIAWRDHDGLTGLEPFELALKPALDELPSVIAQDLPRQAVVLDSEQINFQALAADDYGVKQIGISWKGLDTRLVAEPAVGEKLLSAGGPHNSSMQVPGTFSAVALGIPAQPIEVQLWVEDYMPDHERVYSAPHVLYVLTAEEHAIWITSQLSKWHRASLDVRDKEMQLHETNKRLRAMSEEELADEEMRNELRRQSSLEAANGRRLSALSKNGEDLLRQAARNPEIGVGHLDRWAEMLQILNDIGSNRMPSVSDLLDKASTEKQLARAGNGPQKPTAPSAGKNRNASSGSASKQEEDENMVHAPKMPSISDQESSQQPIEGAPEEEQTAKKKKGDGSKLSLPKTTLAGPAKAGEEQPEEEEEQEEQAVDQALIQQEDLLAEFEKIADELNTLLANLEGSTLVKRLKAASREQNQVAEKISSRINAIFGLASQFEDKDKQMFADLASVEDQSSQNISYIMDDMQSYFERRRMNQFKVVLDDMRKSEVLVALQKLGEEIPKEHGISIAQAEYWSDTLDRWAEDLVDPACSGQCPGCKTSDALPPSLILEVLKILESEVNLREETRVAEQARAAIDATAHSTEANRLSQTQSTLRDRTDAVVKAILDLPMGDQRFAKEIDLLSAVSTVMEDAQNILASSDTGSKAIAAETEAIELLLQCKRINPKGGGGGGSSPGGGGTGTTQDSALALLGSGLNQNERREARDVMQATGDTGRVLPEEFRAGLDAYFERLEQGR
ncbi:MAG: hypothetical protein R3C53_28275 [Pirellulaceae bacterium]